MLADNLNLRTPAGGRNPSDLRINACLFSLMGNSLMRLVTIILLVTVILPEVALAATEALKLRFDTSVLDRAEQYLSLARRTAQSVDLDQLPSLTPELQQRIEFSTRSIIQHTEQGHTLITTLRHLRSLSTAFLLSKLVDNVEELLDALVAQLFQAAKAAGELKVDDSRSPVDQARETIRHFEQGRIAHGWAMDAAEAQLPLGKVSGDVAAAVLEITRAADIVLDECLNE